MKVKRNIILLVTIIALLAVSFIAGIFVQGKIGKSSEPKYDSATIGNEVKNISQYATMEYHYTNVGKFENNIDFYGWEVPFTTKAFIITYDGSMKLGVDGKNIDVNVKDNQILIKLPEIKILSHEIYEDTIEVMDQSKNIFNQIEIQDYTGFATDQKKVMEKKAKDNNIFEMAEKRTKNQLNDLLMSMPGMEEQYEIKFIN